MDHGRPAPAGPNTQGKNAEGYRLSGKKKRLPASARRRGSQRYCERRQRQRRSCLPRTCAYVAAARGKTTSEGKTKTSNAVTIARQALRQFVVTVNAIEKEGAGGGTVPKSLGLSTIISYAPFPRWFLYLPSGERSASSFDVRIFNGPNIKCAASVTARIAMVMDLPALLTTKRTSR